MEGAVTSPLIRNSAAFQRNDIRVLLNDRTTYEFNDSHIDRTSVVGPLRGGIAVEVAGARHSTRAILALEAEME
ncbi:MAG: hypothetical protein CMQ18_00005 [Gammaproteobacteria bacterium]|nr:hypothetical protein [Gammaproteobacteria bacterium]